MERTGVVGLLALDSSEAFRLANRSDEPAIRVPFLGGVTGTGATIWLGMLMKRVGDYDGNCVICEEEEVGTGDQDYIISESRLYDAGGFGAMMM